MKTTRAIFALPLSAALLLAACWDGGDEAERPIGTAFGSIFHMRIGTAIERQLDEAALQRASAAEAKALTLGSVGQAIRWEAPENEQGPASGAVTVIREGRNNADRFCRDLTHEITVDGESETARVTACQDEDGNWSDIPGIGTNWVTGLLRTLAP